MVLSTHQPQYLPWIGYFDKIAKSDCFVFLDRVQYKPREFQNRNKIRTKDGWMWLSVPVISKGQGRQNICDCRIDNTFPWARKHLNSLKVCYSSAKYFKEHFSFFEELYSRKCERLVDLNVRIINYILKQLSILKPICFESKLNIAGKGTERIIGICQKLKAGTYLSGIGGKAYLEEGKFIPANVALTYQRFVHPVYHQQFMKDDSDFIPSLSIVDLLFNEGRKSRQILGFGV